MFEYHIQSSFQVFLGFFYRSLSNSPFICLRFTHFATCWLGVTKITAFLKSLSKVMSSSSTAVHYICSGNLGSYAENTFEANF